MVLNGELSIGNLCWEGWFLTVTMIFDHKIYSVLFVPSASKL